MPYLSTVMSEATMKHSERNSVDQPDIELDYEDDGGHGPETIEISMSPEK